MATKVRGGAARPARSRTLADGTVVVRPRSQLVTQSRIVAASLVFPVFAAMLWFAIPRGTWPRVLIAVLFITVLYAAGATLLRGVSIRIGRDGLAERGFFVHNNRIPAKRIATGILVDVYNGSSTDTDRQLFLLDSSGYLLLRMRGEFWSDDDIDAVAGAFPIPVQRLNHPLTGDQLRRDFPELLYWFERWPWAGRLALAGMIALVALILIALMSPSALVVA